MKIQKYKGKIKIYKIKKNIKGDVDAMLQQQKIKSALDKISSKLNILEGKDGMIKLDKNNKGHVDWYKEEDYYSGRN